MQCTTYAGGKFHQIGNRSTYRKRAWSARRTRCPGGVGAAWTYWNNVKVFPGARAAATASRISVRSQAGSHDKGKPQKIAAGGYGRFIRYRARLAASSHTTCARGTRRRKKSASSGLRSMANSSASGGSAARINVVKAPVPGPNSTTRRAVRKSVLESMPWARLFELGAIAPVYRGCLTKDFQKIAVVLFIGGRQKRMTSSSKSKKQPRYSVPFVWRQTSF